MLKRIPLSADPDSMFFPRVRPPVVEDEGLQRLWLALNTPVLCAGELPAGPARAAIALHDEAADGLGLWVVVRSLGDGAGVCWRWSGSLDGEALRVALDAALCFAESMGFLFDEDALEAAGPDARRRALDGYREVAGWPESQAPGAPESLAAEPAPAAAGVPEAARTALPLTKFRRRLEQSEAGTPPAARPSALGRLRLVKRARAEAGERPPLWLRLLGSF